MGRLAGFRYRDVVRRLKALGFAAGADIRQVGSDAGAALTNAVAIEAFVRFHQGFAAGLIARKLGEQDGPIQQTKNHRHAKR